MIFDVYREGGTVVILDDYSAAIFVVYPIHFHHILCKAKYYQLLPDQDMNFQNTHSFPEYQMK